MKEMTQVISDDGILLDQRTETGGVRTYGTHVRFLNQLKRVRKNVYRVSLDLNYPKGATIKGALTCTVAQWQSLDPKKSFMVGCFIEKTVFKPRQALIYIRVTTENAEVLAVNIEGRIVMKEGLTL